MKLTVTTTAFGRPAFAQPQLVQQARRLHLQWFFAAEDEGRSEQPSQQKLRRAREEGRVPRSLDFSLSLSLLLGSVSLLLVGPYVFRRCVELMERSLAGAGRAGAAADPTGPLIGFLLLTLLPTLATSLAAALAGGLLQHGWVFSTKALQVNFDRIQPRLGAWLKRSFGWPEGPYTLGKNLLRVALLALLAVWLVRTRWQGLYFASRHSLRSALAQGAQTVFLLLLVSALTMLFLALFDLAFQRQRHRESLKMSRQELKEEQKQTDGDPIIRSQLRRRMRDLLQANLPRLVQQSTVVISNPTHYAVAICWDEKKMDAPTVSSKGQDTLALRIRQLAKLYGVPVMENKPLARALYRNVKVGELVPSEYWELLARIIAEVYRMQGRS